MARVHFDGSINFLDFFLPKPLSSADRARSFLWFMYHYLESPNGANPFDDEFSRNNHNMAPYIRPLSPREAARENVDTEEEIIWGNQMSNQRNVFLHKLVSSIENDKKAKPAAPHFVPGNNIFTVDISADLCVRTIHFNKSKTRSGAWPGRCTVHVLCSRSGTNAASGCKRKQWYVHMCIITSVVDRLHRCTIGPSGLATTPSTSH